MTPSERLPLPSQLGLLALLGSGALLGGAYYFQYIVDLPPCELCLLQRWPWDAAIVITLVALFAGSRPALPWVALLLAGTFALSVAFLALASFAWPRLTLVFMLTAITALIVTASIGVFHVGVEYHWWAGPQACSGNVPRGLSPEQLKKYLFGAKMVRCDETAWQMWGISMAAWNALLSAALALVLASGIANWVRSPRP